MTSIVWQFCFVGLLLPIFSIAQNYGEPLLLFRQFSTTDKNSLILEGEPRMLSQAIDSTYSITVIVTNIRNTKGVIRLKFYDDNTPFPHDTGFLRIVVKKSQIENQTFTATYHGFTSKYMGIALHDDENSNKKLDFDWFLPGEGYAFSDYYHTSYLRPRFSSFRFLLSENKHVVMKIKYY